MGSLSFSRKCNSTNSCTTVARSKALHEADSNTSSIGPISTNLRHDESRQMSVKEIDRTTRHIVPEETWFGEEREQRIRGINGTDLFNTGAFAIHRPNVSELSAPNKQYETDLSLMDTYIAEQTEVRANAAAKAAQLLRHGLAYGNGERMVPILAIPNVNPREYGRRKRAAGRLIDEYEYEASSPEDDEEDRSEGSEGGWEGRFPALRKALARLEQPPKQTRLHESASARWKGTESPEESDEQGTIDRSKKENLPSRAHDSMSLALISSFSAPDATTARRQYGHPDFGLSFWEALNIAMAEERKSRAPKGESSSGESTKEEGSIRSTLRPIASQKRNDFKSTAIDTPRTPLRVTRVDIRPYTAIERYMAQTLRRRWQGDELAAEYNALIQSAHPYLPVRSAETLMRITDGQVVGGLNIP